MQKGSKTRNFWNSIVNISNNYIISNYLFIISDQKLYTKNQSYDQFFSKGSNKGLQKPKKGFRLNFQPLRKENTPMSISCVILISDNRKGRWYIIRFIGHGYFKNLKFLAFFAKFYKIGWNTEIRGGRKNTRQIWFQDKKVQILN